MKPFIFGDRNGVHIIDLDQTLERFEVALDFLREITGNGGKVLFVGTKRQAQAAIEMEAKRANQYYVNRRWLGGMLTNFRTVKRSIDRYKQLLALVEDEEKAAERSKRELSRINRQIDKYSKSLDGIKEMTRLPDALFVVDVNREHIAVTEARRLGIPIIAVVDTNCDPNGVDVAIPGNDDAIRAILLYCVRVADACAEGNALHQDKIVAEESARPKAAAQKSGPATGRKVVEITQQPRRGHSADGESGRGRGRGTRGRKKEEGAAASGDAAEGAKSGAEGAASDAKSAPSDAPQTEAAAPEAPAQTE
jgi:small subunit ribosomal protein S2